MERDARRVGCEERDVRKETGRKKDRQIEDRQIDIWIDRWIYIYIYREREEEKGTDREIEKERDSESTPLHYACTMCSYLNLMKLGGMF